jgi:hypothetical protein
MPQYFFMAWCLIKHRYNFTFYLMGNSKFFSRVNTVLLFAVRAPCALISRHSDEEMRGIVSQCLNLFPRDTTSAIVTGCVILVSNQPPVLDT